MDNKRIKEILKNNHKIITESKPEFDGLFSGKLGLAYYHSVLYQISEGEKNKDISTELLEEVLDDFYSSKSSLLQATYTNGAAGLGYIICYLNNALSLELDIENDLSDLDEYIYNSAIDFVEQGNLDCLHGAGGILFYFTERGNEGYLNKLVPIILSKSIKSTNGEWFQNLSLGEEQDDIANFSISHGMAGLLIIILKSTPYLDDKNIKIVRKKLKECTKFINTFYSPLDLKANKNSFYPPSVDVSNHNPWYNCRLAWCYGDLGIALLFYEVGKFLDDDILINKAKKIGHQTLLRKSPEETGISDPFYCHGTAGISSLYYKLYLVSEDETYIDGMNYWMKKTESFFSNTNSTLIKSPHEILDGLIGVNIAILEYLNKNTSKSLSNIFFL